MKTLTLMLLLLLCGLVVLGASSSQTKLEYKLDLDCSEKKINARSAEGWHLVSIAATEYNGIPTVHCAFKR